MEAYWTTVLNKDVAKGNLAGLKKALGRGAHVDGGSGARKTPLHHAAEGGLRDLTKLLCDHLADLDLRSQQDQGGTALHLASREGHKEVVSLLLNEGAQMDARDDVGRTSLHLAAEGGRSEVVEVLLRGKSAVNLVDSQGRTALHLSAERNYKEIVTSLLSHGANFNLCDQRGLQPLHTAAGAGANEVVKILLEKGAPKDAKDKKGETAVHQAASQGHTTVLQILVHHGYSLNSTTASTCSTPLHLAASNNHLEAVKWMIEAGAPTHTRNHHQETPEDVARRLEHVRMANYLQRFRRLEERDGIHKNPAIAPKPSALRTPSGTIKQTLQPEIQQTPHPQPRFLLPPETPQIKLANPQPQYETQEPQSETQHTPLEVHEVSQSLTPAINVIEPDADTKESSEDEFTQGASEEEDTSSGYSDLAITVVSKNTVKSKNINKIAHDKSGRNRKSTNLHDQNTHQKHSPVSASKTRTHTATEDNGSDSASDLNDNCDQKRPVNRRPPFRFNVRHSSSSTSSMSTTDSSSGMSTNPDSSPILRALNWKIKRSINTEKSTNLGEDPSSTSPMGEQQKKNILSRQLLVAAGEGLVATTEALLADGADIEVVSKAQGEEGLRPLHLACWSGHEGTVRILLNHGADHTVSAAGRQAMHWAAFGGHVESMAALTEFGAGLTMPSTPPDEGSFTPLHLAADNGNTCAAHWLVDKGVDVACRTSSGLKAEDLAMASGHKGLAKYLISKNNELLLLEACTGGQTEAVKQLLTKGVDVNAISHTAGHNGWSVLHLAADGGHGGVVEVLVGAGAQLAARTPEGVMAVHLAAQAGHLHIVKLLLPNLETLGLSVQGQHLIHWAALGGHIPVLQYLRAAGFDFKAFTSARQTTLHLAADNGNLEAVDWLVQQGVNFNLRDARGLKAEDYAREEGHKNIVTFLHNVEEVQQAELLEAVQEGKQKEVVRLVAAGVSLECKGGKYGKRPVHCAASGGHLHLLRFLLEKGADLYTLDDKGNTVVHWAAKRGKLEIFKYLKDNGCNMDLSNPRGETPLHQAAAGNHLEALRYLAEHGADPEAKTVSGLTPEDLAATGGYYEAVEILQEYCEV